MIDILEVVEAAKEVEEIQTGLMTLWKDVPQVHKSGITRSNFSRIKRSKELSPKEMPADFLDFKIVYVGTSNYNSLLKKYLNKYGLEIRDEVKTPGLGIKTEVNMTLTGTSSVKYNELRSILWKFMQEFTEELLSNLGCLEYVEVRCPWYLPKFFLSEKEQEFPFRVTIQTPIDNNQDTVVDFLKNSIFKDSGVNVKVSHNEHQRFFTSKLSLAQIETLKSIRKFGI